MPLYVQNGKLIQKAGSLGTSAGCCCAAGPCDSQCSGLGTPANLTFTISNAAGLAFSAFNPNGSYIVPSAYNVFLDCFVYRGFFYNNVSPGCVFGYSFIAETHWAFIFISASQVEVRLTERVSGACVGDMSRFTIANFNSQICNRATTFPLTGTATTANAYYGLLSFDWSIDL